MIPAAALILFIGFAIWQILSLKRRDHRGLDEHCEECGYDLRGGVRRCPECGADLPNSMRVRHIRLRDEWPATPVTCRRPEQGETQVVIHEADSGIEADLLRQQLTARGVMCAVQGIDGQVSGITGQRGPGLCRVTVWSGDKEIARGIVRYLLKQDDSGSVNEQVEVQK